ncbi:MAG TPA: hypothetical protein VNF07_07990 [Acidimicrobiales bacterium]|nr:hypothetical protein [Acidimicrobiales bacterium]
MHITTEAEWGEQREALLEGAIEFARVMERRPFQNEAGLRGVSAFALYWFVKQLQPDVVFEVGVWRGFSTWLIEQAAPAAEVWSFDPIFFFGGEPQPVYRSPRARYFREDFSCADIAGDVAAATTPLAFFDDHHRQLARLEQCRRVGIEHVIFDDNPPHPYGHRTLEDERADAVGREALAEMAERYEVFPALWAVDDVTEYRIREAGLGFPVTPDLAYLHAERKWHSYVTYVKASPSAEAARRPAVAVANGGLNPVPMVPTDPVAPASADGALVEQIRRLASASSAAISALDCRIASLEGGIAALAKSA